MHIKTDGLIISSIDSIYGFDVQTGDYLFTLNDLQDVSINHEQSSTRITGRNGRAITTSKSSKRVTVTGTNGCVNMGLLMEQIGGKKNVRNTVAILWADNVLVSNGAATTSYTPCGNSGIAIRYVSVDNGTGSPVILTRGIDYTYSNKVITFHQDLITSGVVSNGTAVSLKYYRRIKANSIVCDSSSFSGKCSIYINAMAEDKCGNIFRVQYYFPKADLSGDYSFEMGGSQTVHSFEISALPSCRSKDLYVFTIFRDKAIDALTPVDGFVFTGSHDVIHF